MNVAQILEQVARLLQAGNIERAENACREVLRQQADHAVAWYYLAMVEQKKGAHEAALDCVNRALGSGIPQPGFWMLKGSIAQDLKMLSEAERCYHAALQLKPDLAQAWNNLGNVLADSGKSDASIEAFDRAISLNPKYVRAYYNLGTVLQSLGRLSEAIACYQHAIQYEPAYLMAMHNLANAYQLSGSIRDAELWYRRILSLKPDYAPSCLAYARLLLKQRDFSEARTYCVKALQINPQSADAHVLLGELCASEGNLDQAIAAYRCATELDPTNLGAALGLHLSLPQVYADAMMIEQARARFTDGLRILHDNAVSYARNPVDRILADLQWINFYLAYQGLDDRIPQTDYAAFVEVLLMQVVPRHMAQKPQPSSAGRRIRVGFLSHFVFKSTAGNYFKSWITDLDRSQFEVFVYYTNSTKDELTAEVEAAADHFKHRQLPVLQIADEVARDALDILVYPEVGMVGKTSVLASMRLAPVQCAGWGHPVTTGRAQIDYYFSSALMEPDDAQRYYTEELVLLPGIGTRYPKPSLPAPLGCAELGLPPDKHLYLCPQSLFKIHPDNDALFLRVLEQDHEGVLVLFAGAHEAVTDGYLSRLSGAFAARDIEMAGRVVVLSNVAHDDYLRVNMVCDVMLDTLHWSGGNTSLDALACGLPLVTLPGQFMRGRQSYGMLQEMGLSDLIAADEEDYARIAIRLGQDHAARDAVSLRIRDSQHRIFEDKTPVTEFSRCLLRLAGKQ